MRSLVEHPDLKEPPEKLSNGAKPGTRGYKKLYLVGYTIPESDHDFFGGHIHSIKDVREGCLNGRD